MNEMQIQELMDLIKVRKIASKDILSLGEAALYMGISKSFVYKLTSGREITFYKPGAKMIFFKREDLDAWMLQKKFPSDHELMTTQRGKGSKSHTGHD